MKVHFGKAIFLTPVGSTRNAEFPSQLKKFCVEKQGYRRGIHAKKEVTGAVPHGKGHYTGVKALREIT